MSKFFEMANRPSSLPNLQKYKVVRGVKFNEVSFRRTLNDLIFTGEQQDIITFGRLLQKGGQNSYSGTYFSNYFKVNADIWLNGVEFFGPMIEEEAQYIVFLEAFESKKPKRLPMSESNHILNIQRRVSAKRGEVYNIEFPTHLRIRSNTWYELKFSLEGPDTHRCESVFSQKSVETHMGTLDFTFLPGGSKQMPALNFSI